MDFEGKAKPENVAKLNYYKELNKVGMQKRLRIKHGDLADDKITVGPGAEGGVRLISHLNVMKQLNILDHIEFAH